MSFLNKLFGSKEPLAPAIPTLASPAAPIADPSKDPNLIRVFDAYGRELFITKQEWRDSVLIGHIKKFWNEPDALYAVIVQSLQDGFSADMVAPAEHLAAIDPDPMRGAVVLANVYREQHRPKDSEAVLRRYLQQHGECGLVLTNLAKVQADPVLQLQTLWHALELDPNQDNGLGWYEVIHREKGGPEVGLEALRRIAALPGSWRARLWLARAALQSKELPKALGLYHEALTMAGRPVPSDMLMQLSGDLGNAGQLAELLELTTPHFDLVAHGLQVGNNLIKALVDLDRLEAARELVQQLYGQNRPDWKQTLSYWDNEIAKAQAAATPVESEAPLQVTMLNIEGPIWLPEASPAHALFPEPPGSSVRIAFLGSTAETGAMGDRPVHQITDGPGRLSRALPLFLTEQVRFKADALTSTLQPWIMAPHAGFMLSGQMWTDEDAAEQGRRCEPVNDYVVVTHLRTAAEPWEVELRLIRTVDGKCLATTQARFVSNQPQVGLSSLVAELFQHLQRQVGVVRNRQPGPYEVPSGADFMLYLVRLEQLLAVRCSGLEGVQTNFLSGERDILDGNLQICLNQAKNPVTRLLLYQTCLSMKKLRADVVSEYREKLERLHREHPMIGAMNCIANHLLESVLAL